MLKPLKMDSKERHLAFRELEQDIIKGNSNDLEKAEDGKKAKYGVGKKVQTVTVQGKDGKTYQRKQMVGIKDEPKKEKPTKKQEESGDKPDQSSGKGKTLTEHARESSENALKRTIAESTDEHLRQIAQKELDRRGKEEASKKEKTSKKPESKGEAKEAGEKKKTDKS